VAAKVATAGGTGDSRDDSGLPGRPAAARPASPEGPARVPSRPQAARASPGRPKAPGTGGETGAAGGCGPQRLGSDVWLRSAGAVRGRLLSGSERQRRQAAGTGPQIRPPPPAPRGKEAGGNSNAAASAVSAARASGPSILMLHGPATTREPRAREGEGCAAGVAERWVVTQGSAAARGGTAAPTAACAHSGAELDRCGCAISASSDCEPTTGRRRGRRQPGGVAVLRLLGEASGKGASTCVALATSIGAAQPRPRHAPSKEAQAAGSEVASP